VLIAGGDQANNVVLATAELYDPARGQWLTTGTMRNAAFRFRRQPSWRMEGCWWREASVLKICRPTWNWYDPTTGIWTSTIPLITSRRGHSVFRLANGKAVIVVGSTSTLAAPVLTLNYMIQRRRCQRAVADRRSQAAERRVSIRFQQHNQVSTSVFSALPIRQ